MILNDEQLRKLQLEQLYILKNIDRICKTYNIQYSLFEGTALGAIRHKAFIPWDDDLDICMDRKNYRKFCNICNTNLPEGYILTNHKENRYFTQSFSKVINEKTAYITDDELDEKVSNGIFVDIFPLDKIKNTRISKAKLIIFASLMNLFLRGHSVNANKKSQKHNLLINLISKIILAVTPNAHYNDYAELFEHKIEKMNISNEIDSVWVDTSCFDTLKRFFHISFFDELVSVEFEDSVFPIFKNYDSYLRKRYGNYMILPDEKDRIQKHGVIKVEFDLE